MRFKHDALPMDHSPLAFQQSAITQNPSTASPSKRDQREVAIERIYAIECCFVTISTEKYYFTKNISLSLADFHYFSILLSLSFLLNFIKYFIKYSTVLFVLSLYLVAHVQVTPGVINMYVSYVIVTR